MKKILMTILFLPLLIGAASNEVEQKVQQHLQTILVDKATIKNRCSSYITKYRERLKKESTSEYYTYKLFMTLKKCGELLENEKMIEESKILEKKHKQLLNEKALRQQSVE